MDDDNYLRVLHALESLDRAESTRPWKKIVSFFKRTATARRASGSGTRAPADAEAPLPNNDLGAEPTTGGGYFSNAQSNLQSTELAEPSTVKQPAWISPVWISSIPLLVVVIVIAAVFVSVVWHQSASGRITSLFGTSAVAHVDLQVQQRSDGRLLLRWTPNSVKIAKFGVVEIEDGSEHRSLRLDSNQLANGSILYAPVSRDLTFRLNAFSGDQRISAFMRVVNGSVAPPRADPRELAQNGPANKHRFNQNPEPSMRSQSHTEVLKSIRASTVIAVAPNTNNSAAHGLNPLKAASFSEGPQRSVTEPMTRKQVFPTPVESLVALRGAASNSGKYLSEGISPARPLRQVPPSPANWGTLSLFRPVDIDVQVRIDDEGHVAEARVINNPTDDNNILATAALNAAKQWIFEPEQVHGKRVPSDHRIVFHFRPQVER